MLDIYSHLEAIYLSQSTYWHVSGWCEEREDSRKNTHGHRTSMQRDTTVSRALVNPCALEQ